jgi:uncharacterized protein (DUF1015 family)
VPLVRPFAALRPAPGRAAETIAPPYDVLTSEEARQRTAGRPWSFLHLSKPEIDLPPDTDPYSPAVHAKAQENLAQMLSAGVLVRDKTPSYYIYRITTRDHTQTGVVAAASIDAYHRNIVRKHEHTRPDKEDDRVRNMEALNAQTGPVIVAYPSAPHVDALLAEGANRAPDAEVVADDGIKHTIWSISDSRVVQRISESVNALPALYIADGHHRSAAASRAAAARRKASTRRTGEESYEWFLVVAFPHHELRILDYNRVVRDLGGLSTDAFLAKVRERFSVMPSDTPVTPSRHGECGLYTARRWYRLTIKPELAASTDPIDQLDVSLLTNHLLDPVLGIRDLRTDKRIDFVGGGRGLAELARRVDSGEMAAAFSLYPTQMQDLMTVADAGGVMPPKSTWFEPKLADGLVSLVLD